MTNAEKRAHLAASAKVGRCRLKRVESRVESAWFLRSTLAHDKLLLSFALNFNLRSYTTSDMPTTTALATLAELDMLSQCDAFVVRTCDNACNILRPMYE